MDKSKALVWGGAGALGLVGAYFLLGKPSSLSSATAAFSCSGTVQSGIPVKFVSGYTGVTTVTGSSPGPSGQNEFPCLWKVAPSTLPVSGYEGGPAITRPNGQVYVTIATDLNASGTFNGQPASASAPWVGIAEYYNQKLVRVYPQPASAFSGSMSKLGDWAGGSAS